LSIRFHRRIAVLIALAAGAVLLVAAPASARPSALQHAPVHIAHRLVHATSSNWAGWDDVGSTYTTVSASWVQPTITCSRRETSYASFWIGLDGDGSNSVEQTGSEGDCVRGTPTYYSWYEFYPAYPVNYSNTVRPGDHFSSTVTSNGAGKYTLTLSDSTQGWTHTTTGSAPGAANASAEGIAEAPSSNRGVLPLANFGTMNFSNATVDGKALGTVPTPQKITMATKSYTKAAVSNLSNNNAFSVTWQHS
jgi:Peptidase A4 family